jgi:hypothetical protein
MRDTWKHLVIPATAFAGTGCGGNPEPNGSYKVLDPCLRRDDNWYYLPFTIH